VNLGPKDGAQCGYYLKQHLLIVDPQDNRLFETGKISHELEYMVIKERKDKCPRDSQEERLTIKLCV
jgi:hypothetical protein